jgi:alkanesulfonate monooxygenase SsuD/methylene tetrahydromethanopterin reductase-like flavin-dependent oxidoreductase (luciferase family)
MAKMVFGIHLPSRSAVDFRAILSYAKRCEDLGIESVWVADHILSGDSGGLYEPLTILSALSGGTEEVHLGTSVLIASLRNPILLADIAGTIQEASCGRLTLGIGAGWDEHEFDSLGVRFRQRGAITDESLQIICGLWKGEPFSFEGAHFTVKDVKIGTPPKRPPPIWIGGNSHSAIQRASRYDAWFPTDPTVQEISRGGLELARPIKAGDKPMVAAHIYLIIDDTTREAERSAMFLSERTGEPLDKIREWAILGDAKTAKERISNYVEAGVHYFVFNLPYTKNYEPSLDRVARLVGEL